MIQVKRAYDPISARDGRRFLVDRLWPRGLSRSKLKLTGWVKEAAPSEALRKWFAHDPDKWPQFQKKYRQELKANRQALLPLVQASKKGTLTLLFAAKDPVHNNAQVLKIYLQGRR